MGQVQNYELVVSIRMTVRYTHVGLEDQAEALRFLPDPNSIERKVEVQLEPAARTVTSKDEVQRNSIASKPLVVIP